MPVFTRYMEKAMMSDVGDVKSNKDVDDVERKKDVESTNPDGTIQLEQKNRFQNI